MRDPRESAFRKQWKQACDARDHARAVGLPGATLEKGGAAVEVAEREPGLLDRRAAAPFRPRGLRSRRIPLYVVTSFLIGVAEAPASALVLCSGGPNAFVKARAACKRREAQVADLTSDLGGIDGMDRNGKAFVQGEASGAQSERFADVLGPTAPADLRGVHGAVGG